MRRSPRAVATAKHPHQPLLAGADQAHRRRPLRTDRRGSGDPTDQASSRPRLPKVRGRTPVVSLESLRFEESNEELFERREEADVRDELVRRYLPLAETLARRYQYSG